MCSSGTSRIRRSRLTIVSSLLMLISCIVARIGIADDLLISPFTVNWRYIDDGSDQGSAWKSPAFDDSQWSAGVAPLGYGDSIIATQINSDVDGGATPITSYYRYTFQVIDPALYVDVAMNILFDDGAVVYLNGNEIFRNNLPAGTITASTPALAEQVTDSP